jgi:hypothetical protein
MIEEPDKMNSFFNTMKEFFLGKPEEVVESKTDQSETKPEETESKEVVETESKPEEVETESKPDQSEAIKKLEEELTKTKLELQKMIDVENKKKSKRIVIEGSKETISSTEDDDVIKEILRDPLKMAQLAEKEPARYSKLIEQYNNNPKKYLKNKPKIG